MTLKSDWMSPNQNSLTLGKHKQPTVRLMNYISEKNLYHSGPPFYKSNKQGLNLNDTDKMDQ